MPVNKGTEIGEKILQFKKIIAASTTFRGKIMQFSIFCWIMNRDLFQYIKILLVVDSLRGEGPKHLRNLFTFAILEWITLI